MPELPLCEPEGMILFHSVPIDRLAALKERGAVGVLLQARLPDVVQPDRTCVLAVRTEELGTLRPAGDSLWHADCVPPKAFLNADPYRACREVNAAGGLVLRSGTMELLLIHRNGVWDLPKGKQNRSETREACALREVREETGVRQLQSGPLLASTMHGYVRNGEFHVKTTYWFAFQSGSQTFVPESGEGIARVAWVPWHQAQARLGYAVLRDLLRRVQPVMERRARIGSGRIRG